MVVAEYQFGQTKVRIHDDCMAKTKEENQTIIDRITGMVTRQYQMQRLTAEEETA